MYMLAATLAGNYQPGPAVLAGLAGGIAFLMVVYMGLGVGMTRMNFLHILGTMMAPTASRSAAYTIGFLVHMLLSAAFGLLHASLLHAIGITSIGQAAGWDLLIGAAHGMVILVAMPMLLALMHPLVRAGQLQRPGVALVGYGAMTPMGSLLAHAAFGLVTGTIYAAAVL
jgi:hypothetical protein